MADAPLRLFISYSRTDSDFVDTLQADLQARNFDAWVDRGRLEGGRDWAQTIEAAIDRCQVVLVVLSPTALASEWVTREYSYAQDNRKRIIPVLYRQIPKPPLRLNELQYVDCASNYAKGLSDLLVALTPIAALPVPPLIELPAPAPDPSDLVEVRPAPPLPNANLLALYRAGLEASVDGDLERAAILWEQVLKQDEDFEHGLLKQQLDALNKNLRPIRIDRLRERARTAAQNEDWRQVAGAWRALLELEPDDPQAAAGLRDALRQRAAKARREGQWGEEIGAYEALLKLEPDDEEAHERTPIAEQNLQWEYKYKSAQDFVEAGKPAAARAELELLWGQAPYYGDPAGIATKTQVKVPPTYDDIKATEAEAEAARKRDAEATRLAEQKRQSDALAAKELEAEARRVAEAQRQKEDEERRKAHASALARRSQLLDRLATRGGFLRSAIGLEPIFVWMCAASLLATIGIAADYIASFWAMSNSDVAFIVGLAAIPLVAGLWFFIGFRRVMSAPLMIVIALLSLCMTYLVLTHVGLLNAMPQPSGSNYEQYLHQGMTGLGALADAVTDLDIVP